MGYSALQREVFNLYRSFLRAIHQKSKEAQPAFYNLVRSEFATNAKSIKRTDVLRVEHLLRKGHKQLQVLKSPHCKAVSQQ